MAHWHGIAAGLISSDECATLRAVRTGPTGVSTDQVGWQLGASGLIGQAGLDGKLTTVWCCCVWDSNVTCDFGSYDMCGSCRQMTQAYAGCGWLLVHASNRLIWVALSYLGTLSLHADRGSET